MKNIHRQLLDVLRSGEKTVLATVIRSSGSTPQKPGSSALFSEKGLIAGTVGGGQLEGEIQEIAQHVIISGISDQYYFNLDTKQGEEGAICGGEASVLVDANPGASLAALEEMEQSLLKREAGHMVTIAFDQNEGGCSVERVWITEGHKPEHLSGLNPELWKSVVVHSTETPHKEFSEYIHPSGSEKRPPCIFLEQMKPMPLLIIAGAGHVGRALAHLGALLDFEIKVIDDRAEYANRGNIPDGDHFMVDEIGPSIQQLNLDQDSYIVIVTRGHNHDAEALKPCIGSDAAYVGMIGSKHKVGVMKKQFIERGWATDEQWSKIHTPIGISIGSKTVQEIAVSIAAELVQVRTQSLSGHAQ